MTLRELMRPDLRDLAPYGTGTPAPTVRLHANENPWSAAGVAAEHLNRYPDGAVARLEAALAQAYGVTRDRVLATRGSDDGIDLLCRAFCRADRDAVLVCPPTFAMYARFARIQGAAVCEAPITHDGAVDIDAVLAAARAAPVRLVFMCSPNNPNGVLIPPADVERLCVALPRTVVVVDEAYIEFADSPSSTALLDAYPNLVVLRTLSKAWGLAGARVGALLAAPDGVTALRALLPPYPLAAPSIDAALAALAPEARAMACVRIARLVEQREALAAALRASPGVRRVWPSRANFLLVECVDRAAFLVAAHAAGIAVRDLGTRLSDAVRVSVGSPQECARLIEALNGRAPEEMPRRRAEMRRSSRETDVYVAVDLDAAPAARVDTGVRFLDHMLEQLALHGGFALELTCRGDLDVDVHHSVEDCALALGAALDCALGARRGIARYGFLLPMDEALAQVALDLGGRPHLEFRADVGAQAIGDLPAPLVAHFFKSFAQALRAGLHLEIRGSDPHHMVEAAFKSTARALRQAVRREDGAWLPSSKGHL